MTYAEQLHAEHKARRSRLGKVVRRPPRLRLAASPEPESELYPPNPEPIQEVVGAAVTRDWLYVESTSFANMTTPLKIKAIQAHVCTHYRVSLNDILSARKDATTVRPRQVAMYICKALTLASLPQIGQRFGGRDHTTVLHAIRKMERLRQTDQWFASELFSLCHQLGGEAG